MSVLNRSFSNITSVSTTWTVTRSSGAYAAGSVIAAFILGNTVFPSGSNGGWTPRFSAVNQMGLYLYDRTAVGGETSFTLTNTAAGAGQMYVWELSPGSTYIGGQAQELGTGSSVATPTTTPTAGLRLLLAVGGGNLLGTARTVSAFSNSFTLAGGGQTTVGDGAFSGYADRAVTADGVTGYNTTATFSGAAGTVTGSLIAAYLDIQGDITAPSVPTGLGTTAVGQTTATLGWNAATDDTGVTGYEIQVAGP